VKSDELLQILSKSLSGIIKIPATCLSLMIKGYKRWISPLLMPRCRFYPSCSSYMLEAVAKYGAIKGFLLGCWRILRCNPFCKGGYDPVP